MAFKLPVAQLSRAVASPASAARPLRALGTPRHAQQSRWLATPAYPVVQTPQGPGTAMVFLNMGGPSTTGEVGDFLSRLFVCDTIPRRGAMYHPGTMQAR